MNKDLDDYVDDLIEKKRLRDAVHPSVHGWQRLDHDYLQARRALKNFVLDQTNAAYNRGYADRMLNEDGW